MRLFLAIFPPESYRKYFRDVLRKLDKEKRNIRAVPVDQVHLTVRFMGSNVSERTKDALLEEFKSHQGSYPRPELSIESLQLGFPRQKYPSAIFADFVPTPELDSLYRTAHKYVREVGADDTILWQKHDDTDYHITIARLKQTMVTRSNVRRIQDMLNEVNIPKPEPFVPDEMYLMQSILPRTPQSRAQPPVYKRLERISL